MAGPYRDLTSKEIHITEYEIENESVFHLKSLYRMIYNWLIEENYRDPKDGGTKFERVYMKKVSPTGKEEIHWWWRAQKTPEGANKDYLAYLFKIRCQVIDHRKVKQKQKGRTYKMDIGAFTIYFNSYLILDKNKEWEEHSILKHFDNIYRKKIIRKKILYHVNEVYKESYRLNNAIRKFFEMQTSFEVPRTFDPEKGYLYEEGPDILPESKGPGKEFFKANK